MYFGDDWDGRIYDQMVVEERVKSGNEELIIDFKFFLQHGIMDGSFCKQQHVDNLILMESHCQFIGFVVQQQTGNEMRDSMDPS